MQATDFNPLVDRVLTELRTGLSSHLTYHSVQHTLDVMEQADAIANREGIADANDFLLIKLALMTKLFCYTRQNVSQATGSTKHSASFCHV